MQEVSKICKKNNILFMVDNTIATPVLFNPIDYGADIVLHSVTNLWEAWSSIRRRYSGLW